MPILIEHKINATSDNSATSANTSIAIAVENVFASHRRTTKDGIRPNRAVQVTNTTTRQKTVAQIVFCVEVKCQFIVRVLHIPDATV